MSDWSLVLFFNEPVENLKLDFYETKVEMIFGNIVILRSDGTESLSETKSVIYTVHDSDHVIGLIAGFYPDSLATYDCKKPRPTVKPDLTEKPVSTGKPVVTPDPISTTRLSTTTPTTKTDTTAKLDSTRLNQVLRLYLF